MFSKLQQNIPKSVLYQKGPRQHEKDFRPNILTLPLVQAYDEEIVKPKNEKKQLLENLHALGPDRRNREEPRGGFPHAGGNNCTIHPNGN